MRSGCYYNFSPFVHHVLLDGEFILLDEVKDRYLILNRMQSKALISLLTERHDAAQGNSLLKDGLVIASSSPQAITSSGTDKIGMDNLEWGHIGKENYIFRKSVIRYCKYGRELVATKLHLCCYGLHGTLQKLRKLKASYCVQNTSSGFSNEIMEIPHYLYDLSVRFPVKIKCLEFSLTLSFLLLKAGCPCVFRLGVQKYDFLSHAWVEYDNKVIGDNPALNTQMPVILEI